MLHLDLYFTNPFNGDIAVGSSNHEQQYPPKSQILATDGMRYIDGYFSFALSIIGLLWHWIGNKADRTSTPRQKAITFSVLNGLGSVPREPGSVNRGWGTLNRGSLIAVVPHKTKPSFLDTVEF